MMMKMGFGLIWRNWIKECLHSSSVAVLINGSLTSEFKPQRGLRQGDPLSPFLFLIVAEGLSALINKSVQLGEFRCYKVGTDLVDISHLQYADDTIVVGEATMEDSWAIKAIMRNFEIFSGLRVNFTKSKICGVNVRQEELEVMAAMVNYKTESLPFKYLGVLVGSNPRRFSTWNAIMENFSRRLASWKARYISLGGRIVLINSVLSSLPVFYFSIYRAPKGVLKYLNNLQKKFLWGGSVDKKSIHWVKWEDVCRSKEEGGLVVKDLDSFNRSLLAKWEWRWISDEQSLWKSFLKSKFGMNSARFWSEEVRNRVVRCSLWWRDMAMVVEGYRGWKDWFGKNISREVGNGVSTWFWYDKWVGNTDLKEKYRRLYQLSVNKEGKVADMGYWENGRWIWSLEWRRYLFEWEKELVLELIQELNSVKIWLEKSDEWRWSQAKDGKFNTKDAYNLICRSQIIVEENFFKLLWCKVPPLKAVAFVWKLARGRIATKDQLTRRNCGGQNMACVLCRNFVETAIHLFFHCEVAYQIWIGLYRWWNLSTINAGECCMHYLQHLGLISGKKKSMIWKTCWFSIIWSIWLFRNSIIFDNKQVDIPLVLDLIKIRTWYWVKANLDNVFGCITQWCVDPGSCIH